MTIIDHEQTTAAESFPEPTQPETQPLKTPDQAQPQIIDHEQTTAAESFPEPTQPETQPLKTPDQAQPTHTRRNRVLVGATGALLTTVVVGTAVALESGGNDKAPTTHSTPGVLLPGQATVVFSQPAIEKTTPASTLTPTSISSAPNIRSVILPDTAQFVPYAPGNVAPGIPDVTNPGELTVDWYGGQQAIINTLPVLPPGGNPKDPNVINKLGSSVASLLDLVVTFGPDSGIGKKAADALTTSFLLNGPGTAPSSLRGMHEQFVRLQQTQHGNTPEEQITFDTTNDPVTFSEQGTNLSGDTQYGVSGGKLFQRVLRMPFKQAGDAAPFLPGDTRSYNPNQAQEYTKLQFSGNWRTIETGPQKGSFHFVLGRLAFELNDGEKGGSL